MRGRTFLQRLRTLGAIALGLVLLAASPSPAAAEDGFEALGFQMVKSQVGPYAGLGYHQAEDGAVAYCMNMNNAAPSAAGAAPTPYDAGWSWAKGIYNVIAYNGYPNNTVISGKKFSAEDARAATQLAAWMAEGTLSTDGEGFMGQTLTGPDGRTEIVRAAAGLYQDAKSGKLKAPRYAKRYNSVMRDGRETQSMLWAPATFDLTVSKRDSSTLAASQAGASLEGAEFELTSLTTPGFSRSGATDASGTLRFEEIPAGTIRVVETKAPLGYRLDPTPREYTVKSEEALRDHIELVPENDFLEHVAAFDIQISKFADDDSQDGSGIEQAAEGVAFEIVANATGKVVGRITTDTQGYASTEGLWFGDGKRNESVNGAIPYDRDGYTVREVPETVPEGFGRVDDWTIDPEQMADGSTLRYIVDDHVLSSRLQIVKRDAETDLVVPLAGFTFQILDGDGKPITQDDWYPGQASLNQFTTGEDGMVTLPERLRPGSYSIREVEAPAPYLRARDDIDFTIEADGGKTEPITTITVSDRQAMGRAVLMKTDGESGRALSGAIFDVVAQEDVISPDGTVRAAKGQVLDTVTTDDDGRAEVDGLYLGRGTARYAFVETKAPDGYELAEEPFGFDLSYKDHDTAVIEVEVEAENSPIPVKPPEGQEKPAEPKKADKPKSLAKTGAMAAGPILLAVSAACLAGAVAIRWRKTRVRGKKAPR